MPALAGARIESGLEYESFVLNDCQFFDVSKPTAMAPRTKIAFLCVFWPRFYDIEYRDSLVKGKSNEYSPRG
jgi:hypothetical protein